MKSAVCLLLVAIVATPLQAKGFYHVHTHRASVKAKPAPVTPIPPPSPAPSTNQVATAQQYYPTQPVRYVVPLPAFTAKTESNTHSPPPVPRSAEDAPKVSATMEDPIVAYQKADAAKGFPEAQYALGVRYLTGDGIPQDEAKGKELIQAAADHGSERARDKVRELRAAGKIQ